MNYQTVDKYVKHFEKEIQSQPLSNFEGWACYNVYNEFISDLSAGSVLELGAGSGTLLSLFPDNVMKDGLSMGKENPLYIEGDMNTPPVEDNSYDLVIARHCLEHSLIPLIMLCEMARVTRKYALIVVPTCDKNMCNMINHYAVFTPIAWEGLFKKAGFNVIKEKHNNLIYKDDNSMYEDWYLLQVKE